jgi:hypothetical protein
MIVHSPLASSMTIYDCPLTGISATGGGTTLPPSFTLNFGDGRRGRPSSTSAHLDFGDRIHLNFDARGGDPPPPPSTSISTHPSSTLSYLNFGVRRRGRPSTTSAHLDFSDRRRDDHLHPHSPSISATGGGTTPPPPPLTSTSVPGGGATLLHPRSP